MARSGNRTSKLVAASMGEAHPHMVGTRKCDRLKDEVYRQMYLVESKRPGAEMKLAIALLRAIVHADALADGKEISAWLRTICPIGLGMLEAAPDGSPDCRTERN